MVDCRLYMIMRDLLSLEFSISNAVEVQRQLPSLSLWGKIPGDYLVSARAFHVSNILMLVLATAMEACQGLVPSAWKAKP